MFRLVSFVVAVLLVGTPAYAQDKTGEVDKIFSFATAETPGCAVGVSQHGKVVVNRAYGLANVERKLPLTQSSLFDIGSTQKQFTAAAVLLLAEDGRLSLSDDIRKHLPQLPDYGHKVTVDHLLTHTGGIRDWTGMLPLAPEGTDVLQLIQRQRGLNFVPGEEWSYSSSGFELAKEIVARVSGMSFAEFARKRLFEPLGMKSSAYVPDILQAGANAALGYQKDGAGWKPYMRLGNNRGGGAIVSTIGDLLVWNDALASGKLGKFVTDKLQGAGEAEQRQEAQIRARADRRPYARRPRGVAFRRRGRIQHLDGSRSGARRVGRRRLQLRPGVRDGARGPRLRPVPPPASRGGAGAGREHGQRAGRRRQRQGRAVLQRAHRRTDAAARAGRQAPHRQWPAARCGVAGALPRPARRHVLPLAGRVRDDLPVERPARFQVDGRADRRAIDARSPSRRSRPT